MTQQPVKRVGPDEAERLIDEGWLLLDVRSAEEWQAGHIPGSLNRTLSQLTRRIDGAEGQPILCVSYAGGRSSRVAAYLALQEIEVADLVGGLPAWEASGRPVSRD